MADSKERRHNLHELLGIPQFHSEMRKCFLTPHRIRLTSQTYLLPNINTGDGNVDGLCSTHRRYLKILGSAIVTPDLQMILENAAAITMQLGIESPEFRAHLIQLRKETGISISNLLVNYIDGIATKVIADLFYWDDTLAIASLFDRRFRFYQIYYGLLQSKIIEKIDGCGYSGLDDWKGHAKTFRMHTCPTLSIEYYLCPPPGNA